LSLAFAIFIVVAMLAVDSYLKNAPHLGYYPSDATWVAYTNETGKFWQALNTTDFAARLRRDGHTPLQQWESDTRASMGLQSTSVRWSSWIGRPLVAAGGDDGVGVCLRPGLLLRTAELVGRALGTVSESNGISRYGDWFFAWRDGYLLASHSVSAVVSLRESSSIIEHRSLSESGTAGLRWRADRDGEIMLSPEDGLPLRGWIAAPSAKPEEARAAASLNRSEFRSPGLAAYLTNTPILTLSGTVSESLTEFIRYGLTRLPASELVYPILQESADALPTGWAEPGIPFAFALTHVDTSEGLAIPEMAYLRPLRSPAHTGFPHPGALKQEWGAFTGWIQPRVGEKLSLCAAAYDLIQLLTSQESLMAELAAALTKSDAVVGRGGELNMTLYWEPCSELIGELLLSAADRELIRRRNREDVKARYLPYVEMLSSLGALQLEGVFKESRLEFSGYVARSETDALRGSE
jgi:hypothetical protein